MSQLLPSLRWPALLAAGLLGWPAAAGTGQAPGQAPAAGTAVADSLPLGRFVRPAVRVGELVEYELTFRHAPGLNVIFPDSTAEFKPFEYVHRRYWPTRTRQGLSLDRCRYVLRTFALDSVQALRLPVTVLRGRDSVLVYGPAAAVRLVRTAPRLAPDEALPPLRQATALLPLEERINYPYWLAGAAAVLVLAGVVWWTFGRNLRQRYRRYRTARNHVYFLAQYARHLERFQLSRSLANMERAITLWKNYLARLEGNSLNTLTTKEIVAHYGGDADVATALRLADRVIYGNQQPDEAAEQTDHALDALRRFADRRYALVRAAQKGQGVRV
ncbi:hypothetical protein LJ737_20185 [Hymenobacter sp. 15J16-1T3B]|uniref:hypothetical protein n=1 Tax=Hymenobacter sp. 15J16-1T3B TaxID=2886941 RepID=UPI001D101DF0|nr:hypothetical protein [Hymenobacter sp. 15J16-1T3B]MCC3159572.1 hypothetical protein [Hymenobacter sp. 15J16-1T3B]